MKDSLSSRVGRILSGSINGLIEAIENIAPETVMEEAIREIDSASDDIRAELGKVVANKHLANKRFMDENKKHDELAEKINFAVKQSRDDLAEAAISQQMDIEVQIPILEKSITDATEKETELESYLEALKARKREMREELSQFIESRQEAKNTSELEASNSSSIINKVARAQSTFDRIMEQNTGLPTQKRTNNAKTDAQLVELDELSREYRIKERLEKIKTDS